VALGKGSLLLHIGGNFDEDSNGVIKRGGQACIYREKSILNFGKRTVLPFSKTSRFFRSVA
jgi:hypothetical protein